MRISLIEPRPPGFHVYSMVKLPRLGLPLIGAVLVQEGHDVQIYVEDLAPVDWDQVYGSDLVGISSTTSTITRSYEISDRIRNKGIPVVIGGPHVTFLPEEALEHCDFVARGECGDKLMQELTKTLTGKGTFEAIGGLSYKRGGQIYHNPLRPPLENLDSLPFPDLSLIHSHQKISSTPIITSLGCPFDCNFCSVTAMFGKKYRYRSAENVMAELRQKRPKNVFFYDDNLAANKKRLKKLLAMMIEEKLNIKWTAQVRADVAKDPALLMMMAKSGCWNVYLGLESVKQSTLDSYKKSQTVADITEAIKEFHRFGIRVHGMFVLGADTDDKSVVRETVRFAKKNRIDTVMLNSLTPLPGTALYQEMDRSKRIFDRRWENYDALHVVFLPKNKSPYWQQMQGIKGYSRFYSFRQVIKHSLKLPWHIITREPIAGDKLAIKYAFWGWLIVKWWKHDKRNKEYLKELEKLDLKHPKKLRV